MMTSLGSGVNISKYISLSEVLSNKPSSTTAYSVRKRYTTIISILLVYIYWFSQLLLLLVVVVVVVLIVCCTEQRSAPICSQDQEANKCFLLLLVYLESLNDDLKRSNCQIFANNDVGWQDK